MIPTCIHTVPYLRTALLNISRVIVIHSQKEMGRLNIIDENYPSSEVMNKN